MSSYVLSAVSPRRLASSARRPSLIEQIGRLVTDALETSETRRFASELMAMSDRQLLDIGIGRNEIASIAGGGRR